MTDDRPTPPGDPPVLLLDVVVLVRTDADARPTRHDLGRLTLTGADRFSWREAVATAFEDAARLVRASDGPVEDDR